MAVRNPLDNAVEPEAAKVIRQLPDGIIGWIESQQLRQQDAHFGVGKAPKLKTEENQHGEQRLDAFVTKPQGRSSLAVDLGRPHNPIEGILANRAIVRNLLDVEQTSVGLKANLPQSRQVLE